MRHAFSINLVANYAGAAWTAALQFLLVPLYIAILGVESYGLIGFCVTLQAVAQFLDFGLSNTINRELARRGQNAGQAAATRDFVCTAATIYWVAGLLIGIAVIGGAGALATHWLTVTAVGTDEARGAIMLMGVVIALQWPASCYSGALLGLQRQLAVNVVGMAASTLFGVCVLLVLWRVSPTIGAFLWCRIAVLSCQVLVSRRLLRRALPPSASPARFDLASMAPVWRFSLGMMLISLTAVLLMQFDKVVLSKILSMEMFGYYMVGVSVASFIPQLVTPIYTAVFPRMAALVAAGDRPAQAQLLHQGAQLIALAVQPVAVGFALFAPDIILVWTGNHAVTAHASSVLTLLAIGALLNSVMVIPYAVQLAFGSTSIGLVANLVMTAAMIPYAIVATQAQGLVGAASAWVVVNAVYIAVGAPLTFRRLLAAEARGWLLGDVMRPITVIVAVQSLVCWLGAPFDSPSAVLVKLPLALLLSAAGVVAVTRELRGGIVTVALAWRTSAG